MAPALALLETFDAMLGGLLAAWDDTRGLVLLTSDHGNLEEAAHTSHTRNPVPLLAVGPDAGAFADLSRIDEVTPRLLARLGVPPG
jgi:phosphopentomutase